MARGPMGHGTRMGTDDRNRPEHAAPDEEARREQQPGEVSEMEEVGPEAGGADATDKSTGTAPDRAEEPGL